MMPSQTELWTTCDFFIRRLFAKGKMSVTDCAVAGHDRMAVRIVIQFLSGIKPSQIAAIIVADTRDADEHRTFADWMMGEVVEDFSYGIFDNIDWRFGKGWRNQYPNIPTMGEEPVDPKSRVVKTKSSHTVTNAPSWFKAGTRAQALNVAKNLHPTGRALGPTDSTCAECRSLQRIPYRCGVYFKCQLDEANWTHGPGTDIRMKWRACSSFKT